MKKFISHVQVPSNNLEESINWYVKYLGGTLASNFGEFAIINMDEGPNINIWKTDDITTSTFTVNGNSFPTIGIQVDKIDTIINSIIESGTNYEGDGSPFIDDEGRKFFSFFDPSGNKLIAHEEPK